ncbi:hypothetical protein PsYK624_091770 [Phanerochaete sordida]|uniref:Uncharacterized protein n=1 Tax=Phanerochaete sordida TaxID=48140 RepID=A0A9P3GBH3_9APHY|nr:hypothetical protein PsYK624_091770 [Phanerochaete sordida]
MNINVPDDVGHPFAYRASFPAIQDTLWHSGTYHTQAYRYDSGDSGYLSSRGDSVPGPSLHGYKMRFQTPLTAATRTATLASAYHSSRMGTSIVEGIPIAGTIVPSLIGGYPADIPLSPHLAGQRGGIRSGTVLGVEAYTHEPESLEEPVNVQQRPSVHARYVPQRRYSLPKRTTPFCGYEPICFGSSLETGVLLWRILRDPESLSGSWCSEPGMPSDSGQKAQIRLNWPGRSDYVKSINVHNFGKHRRPISKIKLLTRIAEAVQDMVEANERTAGPEEDLWRIGKGGVRFENIVLHSLENVSKGSWQPKLSLWFEVADGVGAVA